MSEPAPGRLGIGRPSAASGDPPEQLSYSELKVLRYLPINLPRPEIAAELSVSVNTVSTHIRGIYAKPGTDHRSAAVGRARELRLLAAPAAAVRKTMRTAPVSS